MKMKGENKIEKKVIHLFPVEERAN